MKFLRQPLFHFLVLGALLYGLYLGLGKNGGGAADATTIEISAGEIESLAEGWARTWQRPPTQDEVVGMVEAYVQEEVLYREALAMGLDKGDTIVRRRLRQKLDFLADDLIEVAAPDEATLRAYLAENQARYTKPSRVSFDQVFIDPARHSDDVDAAVSVTLAQLASGTDPAQVGDSFVLPVVYHDVSVDKLARDLGSEFADAVVALPPGNWAGPVSSAYGLHLVRVDDIQMSGLPDLATIRDAVERDWYAEQRELARDTYFRALASRYDVEIEWPDSVSPPSDVTTWQP